MLDCRATRVGFKVGAIAIHRAVELIGFLCQQVHLARSILCERDPAARSAVTRGA